MAKKQLISPKGSRDKVKRQTISERPHFDIDIEQFNEEHYGLYLIVSNTSKADKARGHNRIYIDLNAQNKFFKYLLAFLLSNFWASSIYSSIVALNSFNSFELSFF